MKIPTNKILNGNAAEVLKTIPSAAVRLTLTSPPYDNLRDYDGFKFSFDEIARELYRVTIDGGVVVWIVADGTKNGAETGTSFRQALTFCEIGFRLHDTMIFEKIHSNNIPNVAHKRFVQSFEYMFVLSKGAPDVFNPLYTKSKSTWKGARMKHARQKDGSDRVTMRAEQTIPGHRLLTNVWKIKSSTALNDYEKLVRKHPAVFPEELARRHVLAWSNPGDIILDPMCGSGTTLRVARQLRRRFIGIDTSKKYCRLARQRLLFKERK